jgi:hypothetical protein
MVTRDVSPVIGNRRVGVSTILANTYGFLTIPENRESLVPEGVEGDFYHDFPGISPSPFILVLSGGRYMGGGDNRGESNLERLVAQGFRGSANRAEIARIVLSHRAFELLHNATFAGEVGMRAYSSYCTPCGNTPPLGRYLPAL